MILGMKLYLFARRPLIGLRANLIPGKNRFATDDT